MTQITYDFGNGPIPAHRHTDSDIGGWIANTATIGAGVFIAPTATVDTGAIIGAGVWIAPAVTIGAGAMIGAGATIDAETTIAEAIVDAGAWIGRNVQIKAGVQIGAGATIGTEATIDTGATISAGVKIGKNATIGAGAKIDTEATIDTEAKIGVGVTIDTKAWIGAEAEILTARHALTIRPIGPKGHTVTIWRHQDGTARINAGPWTDTPDKIAERIALGGAHGWDAENEPKWRTDYEAVIALARVRQIEWAAGPSSNANTAERKGSSQ